MGLMGLKTRGDADKNQIHHSVKFHNFLTIGEFFINFQSLKIQKNQKIKYGTPN